MLYTMRIVHTHLNAYSIRGAIPEESAEIVNPQSNSWSKKGEHSVAGLDLAHVPEEHRKHIRQILKKI